jgi:G protein-coupled receptor Mth (Methuselah protein)
MLASVPFLLVTLLVYACIDELQNIHGKCLMSYCFGLILLYVNLGLIYLHGESLNRYKYLCKTIGFVAYSSVLICFLWLNVMCHDIYSTFR